MRAMKSLSFRVDDEAADEARGAVATIQARGNHHPQYSREALLRRGLELALAEARELYNKGRPFRAVPALKSGRPRGNA